MKRRIFTLFSVLAIAALAVGFSLQNTSSSKASAADTSGMPVPSAAAKKLIVGLDDDFPPLCFRDEHGNLVGHDIDMAREVAKRMNMKIEFEIIDWSAKETELANRNIDAIWGGLTITEERKKNILFSSPYMQNHQIVIVDGASPIQNKSDLKDKVVGLEDGSTSIDALNSDKQLAQSMRGIKVFANNAVAMKELDIGRLDAVMVDEVVGRYYASKNPGKYRILDDNFGGEEYGVGLRLQDTALLADLEKALASMHADGTAKRIYAHWFEQHL